MAAHSRHMFDKLTEKDIANALDDLMATVGFNELPAEPLLELMRKRNTQQCVQEIASWLDLPSQERQTVLDALLALPRYLERRTRANAKKL